MHLTGRESILGYLGYPLSDGVWRIVRVTYAEAIRRESSGHVWAMSDSLDRIRVARSRPINEDGRTDMQAGVRRMKARVEALGYRIEVRSKAIRSAPVPEPASKPVGRP